MARYKIDFPNGVSGKPDDLVQRIKSIGGAYDVAGNTLEMADGDKAPTAEYVNAIYAEYGGTATPDDSEDDSAPDSSPPGDKA